MSDSFKTGPITDGYVGRMAPRFDLIGLAVADMGRSLAFYRRLGLDIPASADTESHVEVTLPGGLRMAWDTFDVIRSFHPGWTPPPTDGGASGPSFAFACDSPAEVDAVYAEMTAAGYHGELKPFDAFWGQRYAVLHDPDGNGVDLFAPNPTSTD